MRHPRRRGLTSSAYPAQIDGAPGSVSAQRDHVELGGRQLAYVDLDHIALGDHRLELRTVDDDPVVVSHLGRAHDRFLAEFLAARAWARRAALLQWAGDPPIDSYIARMAGQEVPVHLFADAVTVEPVDATPVNAPLALVEAVERENYTITLRLRALPPVVVSGLGKKTDEFLLDLDKARTELSARTAEAFRGLDDRLAGLTAPDGWALTQAEAGGWWGALREAVHATSPDTYPVLADLADDAIRYGVKRLEGDTTLPFGLAPVGGRVAVEGSGEDGRATYVFATDDIDRLNVALLLTNFRREALYLPDAELGRWALAVRTLEVVRWARGALVARVVHDEAWATNVAAALRG